MTNPIFARIVADADEFAAIVIQSVTDLQKALGRELGADEIATQSVGALLAAAWQAARFGCSDEAAARTAYIALLRRHADSIEGLSGE